MKENPLLKLETSASGEKKKRYAVGSSNGKTNGLPVTRAGNASNPFVIKPFTQT